MQTWVMVDEGTHTEADVEMVGGSISTDEYWKWLVSRVYHWLLGIYWR